MTDGEGACRGNGLRINAEGETTADNRERIEMTDAELKKVVGGFSIGDRVKAASRMISYCPGCGTCLRGYLDPFEGWRCSF